MKKERNQERKFSYEEAKGRFLVIKQISTPYSYVFSFTVTLPISQMLIIE